MVKKSEGDSDSSKEKYLALWHQNFFFEN